MQSTAQGWLVLQLTNSPALLGLTSAAASAPNLVLTLVAGVLADRVDRPRLIIACQLVAAAAAAILAAGRRGLTSGRSARGRHGGGAALKPFWPGPPRSW
jgi:MFS family permease